MFVLSIFQIASSPVHYSSAMCCCSCCCWRCLQVVI